MVDLTAEMASLWTALGHGPAHRGRVLQFVAAHDGEGVSTVAREFARLAAVRARRPVWLIDADFDRQSQLNAVAGQADRFGRLGQPARASPNGSSFYAVTPAVVGPDGKATPAAELTIARPCLGGRLWVTQLRNEAIRPGLRIEAVGDARYWDALRGHADTVVIDAPAASRSDTALILAPLVDATILVVAAETTEAAAPIVLRDEIEGAGGRIVGVVMNRSTYRPPGFLRRMLS